LATNITAIAYISKELKTPRNTLINGLCYTLGRGISYTLLATLIYFGISTFRVTSLFQGWGDKVLGPILIVIGLIMFGIIKINLNTQNEKLEKFKAWIATKGFLGALILGMLFALAFCPYSGVLFFGALMPLVLRSAEGLLLPPIFALGTGLPVIVFAFLIAFSMKKVSQAFKVVQKVEKVMRYIVASVFVVTGLYYSQYLVKYLVNL